MRQEVLLLRFISRTDLRAPSVDIFNIIADHYHHQLTWERPFGGCPRWPAGAGKDQVLWPRQNCRLQNAWGRGIEELSSRSWSSLGQTVVPHFHDKHLREPIPPEHLLSWSWTSPSSSSTHQYHLPHHYPDSKRPERVNAPASVGRLQYLMPRSPASKHGVPSEPERDLRRWDGCRVEGWHEGDVAVEVILAQQARKLLRYHLQRCPLGVKPNSKPFSHRRQWGRDQSQWRKIQWD